MENADSCRRAAVEAIADVEPPQLHDYIEATLERVSMVPGTLTLESAAMMGSERPVVGPDCEQSLDADSATDGGRERSADRTPDGVVTHAAGVQLIYEGLRLTRSLARDEPWTATDASAGDGDLAILAADILVARGFYLLARTDAANKAVRTVQSFGRDQTRRTDLATADGDLDPTVSDLDANLERDVLELAALTGAVAVGETPSPRLLAIVDSLADAVGTSFPPVEDSLANLEPSAREQSLEDHATDRATSATDP
ncbi:DUF7114 family protein [Natrinema altunense]|uniref:Polyprenyl synthetase family protein n=1 Tax=Natrinema altunense (strain JCM 12890 / CGMCC 1.3731 / AJ2) TaxID=1227494 RepID=L9ZD46_NATA2|nr:hypothetical protein [Natrinema altunense]ELY84324.1 hypothetical protein C485_15691 [Natrinema altunense JCM 12890]